MNCPDELLLTILVATTTTAFSNCFAIGICLSLSDNSVPLAIRYIAVLYSRGTYLMESAVASSDLPWMFGGQHYKHCSHCIVCYVILSRCIYDMLKPGKRMNNIHAGRYIGLREVTLFIHNFLLASSRHCCCPMFRCCPLLFVVVRCCPLLFAAVRCCCCLWTKMKLFPTQLTGGPTNGCVASAIPSFATAKTTKTTKSQQRLHLFHYFCSFVVLYSLVGGKGNWFVTLGQSAWWQPKIVPQIVQINQTFM